MPLELLALPASSANHRRRLNGKIKLEVPADVVRGQVRHLRLQAGGVPGLMALRISRSSRRSYETREERLSIWRRCEAMILVQGTLAGLRLGLEVFLVAATVLGLAGG
jgi:hypothetical protein